MDLAPLALSFRLAITVTVILILIGTPLAWWLSQTRSRWRLVIESLVAIPLVLPPTVLGFYLLILLGPNGAIGGWWVRVTGDALTFSFTGLVIASCVYSLPFAIQPIQNAFESLSPKVMEAARTLGASKFDAFKSIALPLSRRGFVSAAVLAFAHTVGEFGVVLMVGGNIPGETRVVSIAIYDHVETLNYAAAHQLSLLLLGFAFVTLFSMFLLNRSRRR